MHRCLTVLLLLFSPSLFAQDPTPLTMERAVELALTRNERAAIADTTAEAAEARLARARTFFFPAVDITGTYRNDTAADTRNQLQTAATLNQTLFNARAFPLLRVARLERDATRLEAQEDKRLLAFDAANAFVVTLSFEQVLRAAEARREFARTSLEDAQARFEAGLVSRNDVTKAELEVANGERDVAVARGSVETARVQLGNLLNAEITGPLVEPAELLDAADDAPSIDAETLVRAREARIDIRAARTRVEAAEAFADEPRARFFPSVGLTAQTRNVNEGSISDRNNEGFLGVTLAWPIFDAGVRRAERAERLAIARGAELGLELALRDVERQLRGAGEQLASEQAALRGAAAALLAARRNADETNELYRQGLATALDLAVATQSLFETAVAEATARYRMAQAYLAVREASGVGPVGER